MDLDYSYKDYTKIVTPRTHALTKTDTGSSETEKPSEDVKVQEGWKASGKKYWYQKADGTRAKKGWLTVGEDKFYLDANGYRVSGWKKIGGRYYYFGQKTGAMQTGWLKAWQQILLSEGRRYTGNRLGKGKRRPLLSGQEGRAEIRLADSWQKEVFARHEDRKGLHGLDKISR